MRIAICDDEKEYRKIILEYVTEYFKEHLIDLECNEFSSGEELLSSDKTAVGFFLLSKNFYN